MAQPAKEPSNPDLATQLANSSADTELAVQVTALETDAQQIDDSEVQAKVQQLIKLIRTTLKSQNLSPKTQRELARLISLISSLDNRHIQQLHLLDLAVSILLEPEDGRQDGQLDNQLANQPKSKKQNKKREAKNLIFVQETRRQVTQQSRTYPDVLRAIITGSGTPYIRLITGLTWFFGFFFGVPSTIYGLSLAATNLTGLRELSEYRSAQIEFEKTDKAQQKQIKNLTQRNNALLAELGRIRTQLSKVQENLTATSSEQTSIANPASVLRRTAANTLANTPASTAPSANAQADSSNTNTQPAANTNNQTLSNIQQEIENRLEEDARQALEETNAAQATSQEQTSNNQTPRNTVGSRPTPTGPSAESSLTNNTGLSFNTGPWLVLLAISIGALGGTVSVIVRADTFIRQAQETDNDLFLTGFFRPFVGMSFAIFCVALVEAGVFSGIFDLSNRSQTDRTYFYIAIAFVAGFSERLVRDVVIKTEDTLAGPSNNS